MYSAALLVSTLISFLYNPRLLSAFPITPDDTANNGLYPSNPPPSTNLTNPTTTTTTTNLTALHVVNCFSDDVQPHPRFHPIPTDCAVAIAGGVLSPDPPINIHKFYDWSYNLGAGDFFLPDDGFWRHRTCAVAVRNRDKDLVGSFSLDEVGITAADVTKDCVGDEEGTPPRQGKHKGGWSKVGSKVKSFYVVVYGVPYSAENSTATSHTATVGGTVQRVPIPGDGDVQVSR